MSENNTPETPTAGQDGTLEYREAQARAECAAWIERCRESEAERDRMRAQIDRLANHGNKNRDIRVLCGESIVDGYTRLVDELTAERDRLRAENAELLKDKARLDWLSRETPWHMLVESKCGYQQPLRMAIDDALAKHAERLSR